MKVIHTCHIAGGYGVVKNDIVAPWENNCASPSSRLSLSMGLMFNGNPLGVADETETLTLLMLFDAHDKSVDFTLPPPPNRKPSKLVLRNQNVDDPFAEANMGDKVIVGGCTRCC